MYLNLDYLYLEYLLSDPSVLDLYTFEIEELNFGYLNYECFNLEYLLSDPSVLDLDTFEMEDLVRQRLDRQEASDPSFIGPAGGQFAQNVESGTQTNHSLYFKYHGTQTIHSLYIQVLLVRLEDNLHKM